MDLMERQVIRRTGPASFILSRLIGGFRTAEIDLLRSTLPGLSLAMKAHTGHDIASGLLGTYLGRGAGSRVHSGAVERGTVDGRADWHQE
jgi:adenylate cyclase